MTVNGSLELIIGPMFSGKSTELLKKIKILKVINTSFLVIKPKIDNRYSENRLVSHDKQSESCMNVDNLDSIDESIIEKFNTIIIDEGQFFKNLKKNVLYWVEKLNKNVIIGGLDGDYKREPIGEILDLIPYADDYKKLKALCLICKNGNHALFSHRLINDTNQILIGEENTYIPLCRKHYLEKNNN